MKKPAILLIDDDPAVLEALEATLASRFGDIARIETFSAASQALAAAREYATEKRTLALAISDQKMPQMSGVHLLDQLSRLPAADGMQSILLTGYAGLDSALEAKNRAGATRYLEKPWSPPILLAVVAQLLRAHLAHSGASEYLVFREVSEPAELERLFALRYEVFRQSGAGALMREDRHGLDISEFDRNSRHLGLEIRDGAPFKGNARFVGSLRAVDPDGSPRSAAVLEVAAKNPSCLEAATREQRTPLPLLSYFSQAPPVQQLYAELRARGRKVVEPGRLALAPAYRTRGRARFMISATFAALRLFRVDEALLTCTPPQERFYFPLGFETVPGTTLGELSGFGIPAYCLVGYARGVPERAQPLVYSLERDIVSRGLCCHCDSFPACHSSLCGSGESSGREFFCPLRAARILRTS